MGLFQRPMGLFQKNSDQYQYNVSFNIFNWTQLHGSLFSSHELYFGSLILSFILIFLVTEDLYSKQHKLWKFRIIVSYTKLHLLSFLESIWAIKPRYYSNIRLLWPWNRQVHRTVPIKIWAYSSGLVKT